MASHSGFLVSKRTRTISNLLKSGPERVVFTDKAENCKENLRHKLEKMYKKSSTEASISQVTFILHVSI